MNDKDTIKLNELIDQAQKAVKEITNSRNKRSCEGLLHSMVIYLQGELEKIAETQNAEKCRHIANDALETLRLNMSK